jgi:hypothetical protein
MRRRWLATLVALTVAIPLVSKTSATPGVSLIGVGFVPGNSVDLSGLRGSICRRSDRNDCIDKATFGGFGSAMTYTGHDSVSLAASDRGPFDGLTDVPWADRVHLLHITVNPTAPFPNIRTDQVRRAVQ